jgi:hypothetical protein
MAESWFETDGGVLMPQSGLLVGGVWHGQHIRDGKVIDEWEDHNLVVDEGLNHVLDVVLHGSTQVSTWYIGVFEGNYTPVSTVTAATITSASTECTAYDESTRVAYVEAAASAKVTTNSANKATFTFNATKTIYGAFLASASAKSATTGTLLSAARFGSSKSVVDDDQLLLTYTFTAASS